MMKRFLLPALAAFLLASCAGLQSPAAPQASLVIGSISLVFPGSFFTMGARTIKDNIEVNVLDNTTGKEFSVYTDKGYFWFTTNGTDEYTLGSCQFSETVGSSASVLGERKIGLKIPATAGAVLHAGDISLVYTYYADSFTGFKVEKRQPDYTIMVGGTSMGPQGTHGANRRDYIYSVTMSQVWDQKALQDYLKEAAPSGPWISRQIVDVAP